jgi:hypothetical protein
MPAEDSDEGTSLGTWTYTLAIASAVGLAASGPMLLDSWQGTGSVETSLLAFLVITTTAAAAITFVSGAARKVLAAAPPTVVPSAADADPGGAPADMTGTDDGDGAIADEQVAA